MNRATLIVTAEDLDIGAKTVAGEARGETLLGQQAVAWVIVNRVTKGGWWGDSIARVCLHPHQFSAWNTGDPNRRYIENLTVADQDYQWGLYAILGAITGLAPDPTNRSTHYHSMHVDPAWAIGVTPVASIGTHRFYDNIA